MTATCPACLRPQDEGLLCASCTGSLEHELGEVAAIVDELDVTLSRQARVGSGGKGGPAHERTPAHLGAMAVAGDLANTLTTWARDVIGEAQVRAWPVDGKPPAVTAAWLLLSELPAIRKHPAAAELVDEVVDAVRQARRVIDRAANRTIIFVGPCPEQDDEGADCLGEIHAFIPIEDDRPSRMECNANSSHKWTSIQWLRAGKRILDTIERRKREQRLLRAIYGEAS